MGVWNEFSLFPSFVQLAHLTDQSTMLSGFLSHSPTLVYVSLLLYLYVAIPPLSPDPYRTPSTPR